MDKTKRDPDRFCSYHMFIATVSCGTIPRTVNSPARVGRSPGTKCLPEVFSSLSYLQKSQRRKMFVSEFVKKHRGNCWISSLRISNGLFTFSERESGGGEGRGKERGRRLNFYFFSPMLTVRCLSQLETLWTRNFFCQVSQCDCRRTRNV
jgi:hypothetical protein